MPLALSLLIDEYSTSVTHNGRSSDSFAVTLATTAHDHASVIYFTQEFLARVQPVDKRSACAWRFACDVTDTVTLVVLSMKFNDQNEEDVLASAILCDAMRSMELPPHVDNCIIAAVTQNRLRDMWWKQLVPAEGDRRWIARKPHPIWNAGDLTRVESETRSVVDHGRIDTFLQ